MEKGIVARNTYLLSESEQLRDTSFSRIGWARSNRLNTRLNFGVLLFTIPMKRTNERVKMPEEKREKNGTKKLQ